MRILIISTHDNRGGAAKAAYRFAKEFINQGHEVCLYVRDKTLSDDFIRESPVDRRIGKILHFLDFLPGYLLGKFNKEIAFTLGAFGEGLGKIVDEFEPDVINIHWTWKGFISFYQVCKISKRIPVVYTMHDYSPFSGGIFYPDGQGFFVKKMARINSFFRKLYLRNSNVVFVSPSKFLLDEFNKYGISRIAKVVVINNGLDLNIFRQYNKGKSRGKLGLDKNKRYILFGTVSLIDNPAKGGRVLFDVLKILERYFIDNNIGLISFGSQNLFEQMKLDKKIETKFLGFIETDKDMAEILSSSNLVLVPSLKENYPFAVLEPLACNIPVVAFRIGGIPEIIKDGQNGYLVRVNDKENFVLCIKRVLNGDIDIKKNMIDDINIARKASEYINLFKDMIKSYSSQ